ncbi:hypothetical protein FHETE_6012 [Fusarium heterosporum]|uniref:Uncharacterized protein n=1 Tax=Fusarium heterosporum TaxID=42747 RepID=A0A8H5WRE2_FUSHE|nr:hypothetical protein FHETE_6012 [Fusarium heterosporum]
MDAFRKLPLLVQTEIFVHLKSELSIKQLAKASISMQSHFVRFEKSILRRNIHHTFSKDPTGTLLKDVLGILFMSDRLKTKEYCEKRLWHTLELRQYSNLEDLGRIFRLLSRIITFIEDYITKATSIYPPRSYLGLPDLSSGAGSYFKGQPLDANKICFTDLTSAEQIRFLRPFLRYELHCKMSLPQFWRRVDEDTAYHHMLSDLKEAEQPLDPILLTSVHEYYQSIYGAIYAHCQNSWLPDVPAASEAPEGPSSTSDYGLLYPDTILFDDGEYLRDLRGSCFPQVRSILPCFGLDVLTQLLLFFGQDRRPINPVGLWVLKHTHYTGMEPLPWVYICKDSDDTTPYLIYDHLYLGQTVYLEDPVSVGQQHDVRLCQSGCYRNVECKWWLKLHSEQVRIYRQRAWGFFDDDRLYPAGHNGFPTLDELSHISRGHWLENSLRRSQRWHDYKAGKLLDFPRQTPLEPLLHGTIDDYLGP